MKNKIIRFFGLKGSWKWACKQMQNGKIVRCRHFTGTVRYKIDSEENGRIVFAFPNRNDPYGKKERWENAIIFMRDFTNTDWYVVNQVSP